MGGRANLAKKPSALDILFWMRYNKFIYFDPIKGRAHHEKTDLL
jgi:hypothetical protein